MTGIERWAAIPSKPGYEASSEGRVRSLDRIVETRRGPQRHRGRVLRPTTDRHGYLYVHIRGGNYKIHALMLEAFVGPRPAGMEGCHDDDVKTNNVLSNLRWDTSSANKHDSVRNGTHGRARARAERETRLTEAAL